jgi:hypothetical protein
VSSSEPLPRVVLTVVSYASMDVSQLCAHVFKEGLGSNGRDALGADAVVFERVDSRLVVHRIQIKLGPGMSDENKQKKWLMETGKKFVEQQQVAEELYQRADTQVQFKYYVLTTRQTRPTALHDFEIAYPHIKVLGAKLLKQHLWSDHIKLIGSPYK